MQNITWWDFIAVDCFVSGFIHIHCAETAKILNLGEFGFSVLFRWKDLYISRNVMLKQCNIYVTCD